MHFLLLFHLFYHNQASKYKSADDHYNKKSKNNKHLTNIGRKIPRSTRKKINYEEDRSDDISSDSGSDKKYSAAKNRNQDETEEDDVSDMEDFQPNKKDIPKKINSKLTPSQVDRKQELSRQKMKTVYECQVCGKSFTQQSNCNKHIKFVHEKKRNYKCEICVKSFGQKNMLKHIKT